MKNLSTKINFQNLRNYAVSNGSGRWSGYLLATAIALVLSACALDPSDSTEYPLDSPNQEDVVHEDRALPELVRNATTEKPSTPNTNWQKAITQNAITQNAITQNAITQNAITQNAITQNALASTMLPDGRLALDTAVINASTEEVRMLIRYIARCALPDSAVLAVAIDGQEYEFPGLLGVAPNWALQAISVDQQKAVSACLLGHVNHYGVPVNFSMRGLGLVSSADEIQRTPWHEGAFFGDLFAATQSKYTCSGDDAPDFTVAYPHPAGDRLLRRCTDIDPNGDGSTALCGFTYVGACSDVCTAGPDGSYTQCTVGGETFTRVASTWLLAYDDPDTALTSELYDEYYGTGN